MIKDEAYVVGLGVKRGFSSMAVEMHLHAQYRYPPEVGTEMGFARCLNVVFKRLVSAVGWSGWPALNATSIREPFQSPCAAASPGDIHHR